MKKTLVLCFIIFSFSPALIAQYSIADIPPSLKNGADMVVRDAEMAIDIKSKNNVEIKRKFVYSILNSSADEYASFIAHYDKINKVHGIEGNLYDAGGIKIRSIKKGEIKDYSATSETNLADDDRVKYHSFNHKIYPYTIEYEITTQIDGLFHLPTWFPVVGDKVAVESSKLRVVAAPDYEVRYKALNLNQGPAITDVKKNKEYSWAVNNYPAFISEPLSPHWIDIFPTVLLAPSGFEMQRFEGQMNNWKNFGLFMSQLNSGRDLLPANIKQQVQQLTTGLSTKKERVDAIYRFLQKNTRYISIQLGIGGWQTLDANFVGTYGYGDCKALTNYMHAMLKEAGITSYPALIRGGRNEMAVVKDFSSNQFNHVILCVPDKDSIWLECTSQTEAPGYLGSFTGDRMALLITPEGGVLVQTPGYDHSDNLRIRNIVGSINAEGELRGNTNTKYYAIQQDKLSSVLTGYSKEQIDEYMRTKFNLTYNIENYSHKKLNSSLPGIEENLGFISTHYASVSGKRIFVNPNILSVSSFKLKDITNRKYDFDMDDPFTNIDTVKINIPAGFKPESVPADVTIQLPNATFKSSIKINNQEILYTRHYTQTRAKIPASNAKELGDFFDKVYKADHSRIVFVKEDGNP